MDRKIHGVTTELTSFCTIMDQKNLILIIIFMLIIILPSVIRITLAKFAPFN